ncbi:MAG TPA: DUF4832 domain-containing protein [Bacteroidales bacterium]|nr:DUF4832 domain-containing protein [Bacteroidales bacterium]
MNNIKSFLAIIFTLCVIIVSAQSQDIVTVKPQVFKSALNNPLKGFRPGIGTAKSGNHPYCSVVRTYIKWNELERNEDDSIEQIIKVCNQKWSGVADKNIKIIPRVYLDWDENPGNEYWPGDMSAGDYSSDIFKQRLTRLVKRLGEVWDNDPRVAWIQMGIIGYWGEQHHPAPNDWQQKLLGDLFTEAFKNKKVLVRRPWETFTDYQFGWYWDSFAHWDQINTQAKPMMENCPDRWKIAPIEGETAYNWGNYQIQPGDNPNVTLTYPTHREWLINYIRKLHCTALGWVADFDVYNSQVLAGADEVQKAFGYRYILHEVNYPNEIQLNKPFTVSLKVENTGSAPFYYNWPVELRLLDPITHEVKWKKIFSDVDIRKWMPGENWNDELQTYQSGAEITNNTDTFQIDSVIAKGKYILALSILDPAGMVPAVKFATKQYFNGGMHPIGYVGIDTLINEVVIDSALFDDPVKDKSLHYSDERGEIIDSVPDEIYHEPSRKSFNTEYWKFPGDTLSAWQYDYMDNESGARYFKLDTAQTIGIYGCNDTSGLNIHSYKDATQFEDAAQFNWNSIAQTFQKNGQWLEYSVLFDIDNPYQLLLRARNNVDANFKLTIFNMQGDTVFFKDISLTNDFKNLGGGNEQTDWLLSKFPLEGLWGAYIVRFDWYDKVGEPGIFGGFSFLMSELDITPPEWLYVDIGTITVGSDIIVQTTEDAKVYLVPSGTLADTASIIQSAVASADVEAYTPAKLSTTGLNPGEYVAYAIDNSNNISEASRLITLQIQVNSAIIQNSSEISITCNPSDELINISSNQKLLRVNVYNLLGKKVGEKKINGINCKFNVNGLLPPGVYVVQIIDIEGISTIRKICWTP